MSKPIIEVKGLSKKYKLGVFNAKSLREEAEAFLARFSRGKQETGGRIQRSVNSTLVTRHSSHAEPSSDFWALRDVSFDVQPGEVIGVIGRNGAGKSTLLKILSRITEPTSGEARIRGRVASLLEVGTGFHPELSGRENVFLNGAILGMSKTEIRSKFDEIVAFAEIEKFIDTPVKRYSSGMYVRLAFAVAAHLRPDVLIVDEVLAVGDLAFQAKCLAHLSKMKYEGTTIMIVSHNMQVISDSCARVIMMSQGAILRDGAPDDVIPLYREALLSVAASEASASNLIKLRRILLNGKEMGVAAFLRPLGPAKFALQIDVLQEIHDLYVNLHINLPNHQQLIHLRSDVAGSRFDLDRGPHELLVDIPSLPLAPGTYGLSFRLVSADPRSPLLWDSEVVTLNAEGFSPLGGSVSTPHSISLRPLAE